MNIRSMDVNVLAKLVYGVIACEDAIAKPMVVDMRTSKAKLQKIANNRNKPVAFVGKTQVGNYPVTCVHYPSKTNNEFMYYRSGGVANKQNTI